MLGEPNFLPKTRRPLQLLPKPVGAWHCICMHLITILPKFQRYDAILVIVERFAKLAHMVLIVGIAITLKIAEPILKGWWKHYGLPMVIFWIEI